MILNWESHEESLARATAKQQGEMRSFHRHLDTFLDCRGASPKDGRKWTENLQSLVSLAGWLVGTKAKITDPLRNAKVVEFKSALKEADRINCTAWYSVPGQSLRIKVHCGKGSNTTHTIEISLYKDGRTSVK